MKRAITSGIEIILDRCVLFYIHDLAAALKIVSRAAGRTNRAIPICLLSRSAPFPLTRIPLHLPRYFIALNCIPISQVSVEPRGIGSVLRIRVADSVQLKHCEVESVNYLLCLALKLDQARNRIDDRKYFIAN